MIAALALILVCQLIGDAIARLTGLPLPAPVIGMLLLFLYLMLREHLPGAGRADDKLDLTCESLLQNMALMFVPAGVGIVQRLDVLGRNFIGLAVIVVVTTAISITVTALTFKLVDGWMSPKAEDRT